MRRIIFILVILSVASIITGCTSGTSNQAKFEKDIYKGTSGVVLDLFQDKMPSEVYEGETISYVAKITNKGPYPVTKARFLISLEKGYMQYGTNGANIVEIPGISLEGKSIFNTIDDFDVRSANFKVNKIDGQSEYHDTVITTNFCYDYKGIAVADVCIDTDPYSIRPGQKACTAQSSISLSEGQGGPVVITQIEPRMLIENSFIKPQFIIHIANQGIGFVIKPGMVDQVCSANPLTDDAYNSVVINNIKFSKYTKSNFECYPEALVLKQDQDTITCTLKTGQINKDALSFITPLEIEISYGYMFSQSKEIKIKKILKY